MMGISGGSMNALLTAGARMEQASMQGRVANNVRANANILRAEIKQDAGRGASVEKKENALKEREKRKRNRKRKQRRRKRRKQKKRKP